MRNAELIFIPTPAVGHLVPVLEFARRLTDQDDRIRITIILLKRQGQSHVDAYVKSMASSLPFVRFIDVPELEEKPTHVAHSVEAHVYDYVERNIPRVRNIVMNILSSSPLDGVAAVKGIVADFFCLPMIDIAKEVSLPFYVFLTMNSGFLAMMQYLADRKDTSVFVKDPEEMLSIPGFVNPVPTRVLPSGLFMEDGYDADVKFSNLFAKANGILVNSSFDIEQHSLNHFLNKQNYPPVYAVGPICNLKAQPHPDKDLTRRDELMKWLDDQPEASVVFLCFGSMGKLRGPLVKEIARGLELCQSKFLWSLRTEEDDDLLPEGFLERVSGRGMICGWSPQVEILAHKAVGGFVSHCGWNSIVESLWFGVPIVTWPMYAEQQLNAFLMVKELKIAVEMRLDYRIHGGELVSANEIETAIRCVMDKDNNLVRKRVMDVSQMARKATLDGGSSYLATEKFIQNVIGIKP
ncbi:unnamed protein product [Microthlaspi erraticum]|uniref:Glycosyltransferase n=1 Tax=Microthlaspi erraticum TaxID=1685480 RepID=A0A6D2JDL8_9BRAS|nr:unnamed protein product [Microthlaspi erraticum]